MKIRSTWWEITNDISAPTINANTVNSACPPGAKARSVSMGGAKPAASIASVKIIVNTIKMIQNPRPAIRSWRISFNVMPAYLTPTVIPIKNWAIHMASAGGRWSNTPESARIPARMRGPRIEAPNMPIRLATCQPIRAQSTIMTIWDVSMDAAGAPGRLLKSEPQTLCRMKGSATTMMRTRVAWIKDKVRTLPPACQEKQSANWFEIYSTCIAIYINL